MKHIHDYITLALMAALTFTACSAEDDELAIPAADIPVAVNMSRAEGASAGGNYSLMFWTGTNADWSNPWFHSLGNTDATAEANQVDAYHYGVNNYTVTKDNQPILYPADNSPIFAVGYYPSDSLVKSTDHTTLKLNTSLNGTKKYCIPGLVDICSTEIEKGTETAPFTANPNNELQYNHTQVKVRFQYKRTENVNGRIAQIWTTISPEHMANTWTLSPEIGEGNSGKGYVASHDPDDRTYPATTMAGSMMYSSTEDWYSATPDIFYTLRYTYYRNHTSGAYDVSPKEDGKDYCYLLPESGMFSGADGQQQYITFRLDAVIMSNDINIPMRRLAGNVTVPLKDEYGNPWTTKVKGGDYFLISIVIEQNRFQLFATKKEWKQGGWIIVPIDPYK